MSLEKLFPDADIPVVVGMGAIYCFYCTQEL